MNLINCGKVEQVKDFANHDFTGLRINLSEQIMFKKIPGGKVEEIGLKSSRGSHDLFFSNPNISKDTPTIATVGLSMLVRLVQRSGDFICFEMDTDFFKSGAPWKISAAKSLVEAIDAFALSQKNEQFTSGYRLNDPTGAQEIGGRSQVKTNPRAQAAKPGRE